MEVLATTRRDGMELDGVERVVTELDKSTLLLCEWLFW